MSSAFAVEQNTNYQKLHKTQAKATPTQVLQKLKDGNARYLAGEKQQHDFRSQAKFAAVEGQFPLAFILNCVDSRSIPQVVFNQSAGSIFVGRVAGNVLSPNMLGSMEFAAHVGSRLFVIMGHTKCGAVGAACTGNGFGNINHLISEIKPAVNNVAKEGELACKDAKVINNIAKENVLNMIQMLIKRSPYLAERIKSGQIKVVGAMHNIKTGKVDFL